MLACIAMRELEASVDTRAPRVRMCKRILVGAGFGIAGLAAALGIWSLVPMREVPVIVELQPIVVSRETPPPVIPTLVVEPKPAPPPPVSTGLSCPVLDASPEPDIGVRVRIDDVAQDESRPDNTQVVASRHGQTIAVLLDHEVRLSVDDGTTFRRVFRDHAVSRIALASDGTLYAVATTELGIRTPEGRETWREPKIAKCVEDRCVNRIATLDDELVWMSIEGVATSRDRGRTWKTISTPDDSPWNAGEWLFSWRGAVYAIDHYVDRCGVDDSPVWRLSQSRKISHTIFHNYYQDGEPVLRASDDAATTWTWRERCPDEGYGPKLTACKERDHDRSAMLMAKTLLPVEGARTLSAYQNSLVELCADGARQIYRRWPVDQLDAVDTRGRPLVVIGRGLYRWSAQHGWRRLHRQKPATPTND